MPNSSYFIDLEEKYGAHNYHPLDVVITKGEGVWVYDVDGKRYLDCLSAYSALNQGHNHPKIREAMVDQLDRLTLTSRAFRNDQLGLFYKKLHDMTGYDMSLPMNSGAEAVETAIKVARKWAYVTKKIPRYDAEIIVAKGNFHGRTTTIISFTSTEKYKKDFGPFTPGFPMVEFGDIEAIKAAINQNTAAIMLEPIQGENGIVVPPKGYLKEVENICRENNLLLIADEIQTGLGRTGALFASDHEDVRPDIIIIGKALSGGFYPVSAILADEDVLGLIKPGEHGSTFGGNPLGVAVAKTALEVIEEENLLERASRIGEKVKNKFTRMKKKYEVVGDVRGLGAMVAIELVKDRETKEPASELTQKVVDLSLKYGLILPTAGLHGNVIRLLTPLVIEDRHLEKGLEIMDRAISKAQKDWVK